MRAIHELTKEACWSSRPALVAWRRRWAIGSTVNILTWTSTDWSWGLQQPTSGQVDATNGHAMASQQPEPLVQPSGLSVQGPTMQTGRCCFCNLFSFLFCLHNYYSLTICTFSKFLLFTLWLLWSMQVLQYNLWNHVIRDTTFFISLVAPSTFSLFILSLSPLSF